MSVKKATRKSPIRMCVGCRERFLKKELVRVVRTPEGNIQIDKIGKVSGRGAYVCDRADCLEKAIRSKALQRALEVSIDEAILESLRKGIKE